MKSFMHLHVRIHRWVLWWMVIGVVCGVVAVTNILEHNLTRAQERILIAVGVLNWMLGGLICYAFAGIEIEESAPKPKAEEPKVLPKQESQSYAASDFLLPGSRKSLLPPRYR
jgi:hypothetical protein